MEQGRIFIEGLPCAGKSLLTKELEAKGQRVVHELGRVLPKDSFPGDGKNIEEIKKINSWFIDKEQKRLLKNQHAYFDRSFFTHLVYAYAYEKYSGIKSFQETVDQYQDSLNQQELVLPEKVIYLDENPETSIQRQEFKILIGRTALASFWRDKTFLKNTLIAYDSLFENLSGIDLIKIDADLSTEEKILSLYEKPQETINNKSIDLVRFKLTK